MHSFQIQPKCFKNLKLITIRTPTQIKFFKCWVMPKEQCITQLQNFILFSFVPTRYHKKKKKKNNMGHF